MTAKLQWLGLAAALIAYFGLKIAGGGDTIDFKYIWLAGELWSEGVNPYTDVYVEHGEAAFQGLNVPLFWVYPPNWWPIATGMAALPYETAGVIWRLLSIGCLILGCFVVSQSLRAQPTAVPDWGHIAFWALCATMSSTAITLSLGQTSMVMFLGICLYVAALLQQNRVTMGVALVLLALKPTLGLVLAVALFPARRWWPAILGAGAVTLAMTVPALIHHGATEVFANMLDRLRDYGQIDVNRPPEMTGLRHLADKFTGNELSTFICLGVGISASFLWGIMLQRAADGPGRNAVIAGILVAAGFFVPMHSYDLIFIGLVLILIPGLPIAILALCVLGIVVLWRANNFEALTGLTDPATIYFKGSLLSSIALLGILLVLVACVASLLPTLKIMNRSKLKRE